jgi:hypothetical protein
MTSTSASQPVATIVSSKDVLNRTAEQYGAYLEFPDATNDSVVQLKDTVEHLLTQFDELHTVVDSVSELKIIRLRRAENE